MPYPAYISVLSQWFQQDKSYWFLCHLQWSGLDHQPLMEISVISTLTLSIQHDGSQQKRDEICNISNDDKVVEISLCQRCIIIFEIDGEIPSRWTTQKLGCDHIWYGIIVWNFCSDTPVSVNYWPITPHYKWTETLGYLIDLPIWWDNTIWY